MDKRTKSLVIVLLLVLPDIQEKSLRICLRRKSKEDSKLSHLLSMSIWTISSLPDMLPLKTILLSKILRINSMLNPKRILKNRLKEIHFKMMSSKRILRKRLRKPLRLCIRNWISKVTKDWLNSNLKLPVSSSYSHSSSD